MAPDVGQERVVTRARSVTGGKVFSRPGYDRATTREIPTEAGASEATLRRCYLNTRSILLGSDGVSRERALEERSDRCGLKQIGRERERILEPGEYAFYVGPCSDDDFLLMRTTELD